MLDVWPIKQVGEPRLLRMYRGQSSPVCRAGQNHIGIYIYTMYGILGREIPK